MEQSSYPKYGSGEELLLLLVQLSRKVSMHTPSSLELRKESLATDFKVRKSPSTKQL